jgi:hypothetical protein
MKKNRILPLMCCICGLSIVVMLVVLGKSVHKAAGAEFVPPEFDSSAEAGTPDVPEGLGYTEIYQEGMEFRAYVCGRVVVQNRQTDLFFTNDGGNTVWMKLRILDEKGNILGETGIIKPGEYVRTVRLQDMPSDGSPIQLKIMTYEPDTYYSEGAVVLNTSAELS